MSATALIGLFKGLKFCITILDRSLTIFPFHLLGLKGLIGEIDNLQNNNINELKVLLANKATAMLHGKKAAENSEQAAKEAFSGNSLGANLPSVKIKLKELHKQMTIMDLIILSKLENSKSEIRRLIKGKAIKINNIVIDDEKLIIDFGFFNDKYLKLSIGKKRPCVARCRIKSRRSTHVNVVVDGSRCRSV